MLIIEFQKDLPEATEVKVHHTMLGDLANPQNGVSALKHLVQQASIVGHMEACGWLGAASYVTCYVEFGAGRGKLTGCIHKGHLYSSQVSLATMECSGWCSLLSESVA